MPDDDQWSAGMLLRWVLTRDKASVLGMADDYGSVLVNLVDHSVTRVRPKSWDDVARQYSIDASLPEEQKLTRAVVIAEMEIIPAQKEIYSYLRCGALEAWARPNGSGDIVHISPIQWAALRFRSHDGRDIAIPVDSEHRSLLRRALADYLDGSVPATSSPTAWPDPLFSAEQAMRLWPPHQEITTVFPGHSTGENASDRAERDEFHRSLERARARAPSGLGKFHSSDQPPPNTAGEAASGSSNSTGEIAITLPGVPPPFIVNNAHTVFEWCMIYTDQHPGGLHPHRNGASFRDMRIRLELLGATGGEQRDAYGEPMGARNDAVGQTMNEVYRELGRDIERGGIIPIRATHCDDAPSTFDPTRCLIDIEPVLALARRRGDFGQIMAKLLANRGNRGLGTKPVVRPPSREKAFWPAAREVAFEWLREDGCPAPHDGNQARLEEHVATWLGHNGHEAGEATIRRHVARWIKERRAELNA